MKIDELKKVCDEAPAGPWDATHIFDGEEIVSGPQTSERINFIATARDYWTARHIATFNPDLVKKLLSVVEAAEEAMYPAKLPWTEGTQALHDALAVFRGV